VTPTSGKVAGWLGDTPYLVENGIGKGHVFFITALNLVGSSARLRGAEPFLYANILNSFFHSMKEHIGDGVLFTPWTSLDYTLNEKPDGTVMLLVLNHGDMAHRRDATLRNSWGLTAGRVVARGTWESAEPGGEVAFSKTGDTLAWSFEMAPKSFVLFEFRKA